MSRHRLGCLLVLITAIPAAAQEPRPPVGALEMVLGTISPGTTLRIRDRDGVVVEGRFLGLAGGEIQLSPPTLRALRLDSVDSLWVQGRATKRGALTGAKTAGVLGAIGLGLLTAAVVEGLCETGDCNGLAAGLVGGLIGGAIGAAGGGLVGAAIGSGIPSWQLRYPGRTPAAQSKGAGRAENGLVRLGAAYGRGTAEGSTGGSAGGWLTVLAQVGPAVAIGPELSYQAIGSRTFPVYYRLTAGSVAGPLTTLAYRDDGEVAVFHGGAAVRVGPPTGAARPYLIGSLGVNGERVRYTASTPCPACPPWTGDNSRIGGAYPFTFQPYVNWTTRLGYSLGAGLDLRSTTSAPALGLEARWHGSPGFLTVGVSVGTGW